MAPEGFRARRPGAERGFGGDGKRPERPAFSRKVAESVAGFMNQAEGSNRWAAESIGNVNFVTTDDPTPQS
jgi:hypothetical protein